MANLAAVVLPPAAGDGDRSGESWMQELGASPGEVKRIREQVKRRISRAIHQAHRSEWMYGRHKAKAWRRWREAKYARVRQDRHVPVFKLVLLFRRLFEAGLGQRNNTGWTWQHFQDHGMPLLLYKINPVLQMPRWLPQGPDLAASESEEDSSGSDPSNTSREPYQAHSVSSGDSS